MAEKDKRIGASKSKKISDEGEIVVKKMKASKKQIDGSRAAYINAISLVLSLLFGVISIFMGVSEFTEWNFVDSLVLSGLFAFPALTFCLFGITCAVLGILSVNKITNKKSFENIWKVIYKIFFGLGIFKAIDVVSVVVYALMAISPNSGINQSNLWLNQFLPRFILFLIYLGIACFAKKVLLGKTVLVRIFGIIAAILSGIGCLLVMIGVFTNLYDGQVEQRGYSDYIDEYNQEIDIEDFYNEFFSNPFGLGG